MTSPFLQIPRAHWVLHNDLAFAVFDKYPVNDGHLLLIPHRLIPTWFDATPAEQQALLELINDAKRLLDERYQPDGYNIGINVGPAAGQTVMHLHVHVIPRFHGDMDDPRGGVRHVIPWKGNYLDDSDGSSALAIGGESPRDHFWEHLRPHFASARRIDIVAAFIQDSGLRLLQRSLHSVVERGGQIRLLTGDYLQITQVEALQRLLDWSDSSTLSEAEDPNSGGSLQTRVVEVGGQGWPRSFHPKSWCFRSDASGIAYVGSSNISRTALTDGAEWNLRVRRRVDPAGFDEVVAAFDDHWNRATPLTSRFVDSYRLRAAAAPPRPMIGEPLEDDGEGVPTPHRIQQEALDALHHARLQGRRRALVVHATGLGKTWLAAFDIAAFREYIHDNPRVLFVAHRVEILRQAANTFRRILPEARFGWFAGSRDDVAGDVLFASVQKLTRESNLQQFSSDAFDYLIIDEVHHASAPSYRRILQYFSPGFALGLTATPDRADEADILPVFDDFVAHRADVGEGIEEGFLAPFHYFGIRDVVDFEPIPWRSGRFQIEDLTKSVATEERMSHIFTHMNEHPGDRTILFCCSIDHARFVRQWLRDRGVAAAAVFSAEDSDDRDAALTDLAEGRINALCAVDILNEGVDIPAVDRVVMLRPTESSIVFLQQLGRGLRRSPQKDHLIVLDFVGNHRVFLDRVRTLLSLAPSDGRPLSLREFLVKGEVPELPPGCLVNFDVEAIDLLQDLLPASSRSSVVREYRELREARGARPRAVELFRLDLNLASLRKKHGSWFHFLNAEGDLHLEEQEALTVAGDWFNELERTSMTRSFKLVVIQALLDADALHQGLPIDEVSARCHEILVRSPELFHDIADNREFDDPRSPDPEVWTAYWDKWPLQIWAGDKDRDIEDPFFSRRDGFFHSHIPEAPNSDAVATLTRELVEFRLAQYRARREDDSRDLGAFHGVITLEEGDPALRFESTPKHRPSGELTAALPTGQKWRFRLEEDRCRIARPVGHPTNRLPDLLRGWFGPAVGESDGPSVEFRPTSKGWHIEPLGSHVIPFPRPGRVIAFPSIQAAASAHAPPDSSTESSGDPSWTELPVIDEKQHLLNDADFAIGVAGDSMNGGASPIADGTWALMRWARGESISRITDRIALVRHGDDYLLKRVHAVSQPDGARRYELRSDNPAGPTLVATDETTVIALLTATLTAEDLLTAREASLIDGLRSGEFARAFADSTDSLSSILREERDLLDALQAGDPSEIRPLLDVFLSNTLGIPQDRAASTTEELLRRTFKPN